MFDLLETNLIISYSSVVSSFNLLFFERCGQPISLILPMLVEGVEGSPKHFQNKPIRNTYHTLLTHK